ncbi:DUF2946 family protein [Mesobacterium sp. TK19101]|uniref:DUF2946 family protein n=1 Tax=Mesobacterium hydrothermale TaxID=3111907 RepID=A0ABU6HK28_9RHOB|nr:DUF2946 family protein [Mesobacterium sp. TK19101]MEC3861803.1 DUF2946 family protein [Mesobacterium sp. TK19101]
MRLVAQIVLRALLIVAVLGLATVPDGMMRAQGPDGFKLVLCTENGTQEVWLTADGTVVPADDDSTEHTKRPHCVQVALGQADAPPCDVVPVRAVLRPAVLATPDHQTPRPQLYRAAARVRAPPVPV